MTIHRYLPAWPLPSYIFIPGSNPHPKKVGGHMEGQADPVSKPLDPSHPEQNDFLRYSLDLFNHGYFWESHVYFEALWNAHERQGSVADFLKAMIKLGAAGVKIQVNQAQNARDHFERAQELFSIVKENEGTIFLGFDLEKIQTQIQTVLDSKLALFEVHPDWK